MTIFPCPTFPLAMHSTFGQNCVEAFICSSVVFCIDIVYRCLPLFQVAPASPPPVNAALPFVSLALTNNYQQIMPSWLTFPLHDQAKACPLSCVSRVVGRDDEAALTTSIKEEASVNI